MNKVNLIRDMYTQLGVKPEESIKELFPEFNPNTPSETEEKARSLARLFVDDVREKEKYALLVGAFLEMAEWKTDQIISKYNKGELK